MQIFKNPVFRWSITIMLLGLMFYQLWIRSNHLISFRLISFRAVGGWLVIVFLLMPVNWCVEAIKWRSILSIHLRITFLQTLKAVAGGVALSIFTPNRIGEYGGRIMFLPKYARWPAAVSSLIGSLAQNLVAVTAGVISCFFLFNGLLLIKILAIVMVLLAGVCFFKMKLVIQFVSQLRVHTLLDKLVRHLHYIDDYSPLLLIRVLGIAICRYFIYTLQFILLLHAFEPDISPGILFLGVSAVYLFQALVPLPPIADVLARTNVGLLIWSGTGMSDLSISLASLLVWGINLFIPAMLGSFLLGTTDPVISLDTNDQLVPSPDRAFPAEQPSNP